MRNILAIGLVLAFAATLRVAGLFVDRAVFEPAPVASAESARPPMTEGEPAPGKFVRQQAEEYRGTGVHHGLYLPTNWEPGKTYPVIVEYAPNKWEELTGKVEDCRLGFHLSGGRDFIWVVLPYVDPVKKENVVWWWGSEDATIEYCLTNLRRICQKFGGDPNAILFTGFSRGAIAAGYLALRNDTIADVWLGFLPHSHIDGGRFTEAGARERLARTRGRPTFVTYGSDDDGKNESPKGARILRELGFPVVERELAGLKHTDHFLEKDSLIRREMRAWMADVLKNRPGTHALRGRVVDAAGKGIAGVTVEAGTWHCAVTDTDGQYVIPSLVPGQRKLTASKAGFTFALPAAEVGVADRDVDVGAIIGTPAGRSTQPRADTPVGFVQPDAKAHPDLFVWSDTCNVYVLRDGEAALLIDLGNGSVLDHLNEIGIRRVEWVLFTHHHREQCQGASRLKGWGAKLAAPDGESRLFQQPADFRKMKVRLGDPMTIHGSSYVRPPIQPIPLDRTFKPDDTLPWHGLEILCLATPGNSPAGMSYQLELNGRRLTFSGDVMLDGAKIHTWFDTEWDYGFAAGIHALQKSVAILAQSDPVWLLPSHGPVARDPKPQLRQYAEKLQRMEKLYLRGYGVEGASNAYQDNVSKPTAIKDVAQVSPHLFKFKRTNFWPNFGLILADNGHALVVDCGLLEIKFLDASLDGLRQHFGLKAIDAVIITHMHGDHFLQAEHLREKWGTKIWALDNMVDKMEHPERFDYAAPIQAYGSGVDGVKVDRAFKSGESFEWQGYRFTVDWMPGQTEFALCMHGQIDGRKVAFTGDNIFGDPDDPTQTGHEAMVAHNSAILEEGYIYGAEYLSRLKPEILVGGHSFVLDHPAQFIERYRKWSYEMRDAFQSLSPDPDYRYWFDPFWVRAEPYRMSLRPGESAEVAIHVRNFRKTTQKHHIEIHTPPGIAAEPAVVEGELASESRRSFPIRLKATSAAGPGVLIVALDVTIDGRQMGEAFDFIVSIERGP